MEDAFGKEIINLANFYCTGCFIANENPVFAKVLNIASFSFVDTGQIKIGITNDHVIEEFEKRKNETDDVVFYIGNLKIDPFEFLIDRSAKYDLATFNFDSVNLSTINKNLTFCSPNKWPPSRPKIDDVVVYSGFPGQFTKTKRIPEIIFNSVGVIELVQSVDEEKFTLQRDLDNDPNIRKSSGYVDMNEFKSQGGFSGTLILHIPHTEVITKVEPVGIFYQGIDTLSQISLIRHIDYIDIDGMIRI